MKAKKNAHDTKTKTKAGSTDQLLHRYISCRLPGLDRLHRRLDIRCMPEDQYHFGIVAATPRN